MRSIWITLSITFWSARVRLFSDRDEDEAPVLVCKSGTKERILFGFDLEEIQSLIPVTFQLRLWNGLERNCRSRLPSAPRCASAV